MKKRLLGIILTVAMVICMMPLSISASASMVKVNTTSLLDGVTYAKSASGDVLALAEITNDGTVKCVYEQDGSATLYLNNVTIDNKDTIDIQVSALINSIGLSKLNIILIGENKIIQNDEAWDDCINGNNVTISGSGSLYAKSVSGDGIEGEGYLTIDGVKLTAEAAGAGLFADIDGDNPGILNINGAAVVEVVSSERDAILAATDINFNLTSGGSVKAKTEDDEFRAVYTDSRETITLGANNVITVPSKGVVVAKERYAYIAASADADPALEVEVKYVAPVGADTGDANNIALFAIMGVLALAGAGFAMKKREN